MSSAYSGPYKSHFFNFILSNYHQFTDTCHRTWRNTRYAASTAIQILLYPIYLILQKIPLGIPELPAPKSPSLPSNPTHINPHQANPSPSPLLINLDNTIAEIEPQIKPAAITFFHNFHLWIFSTLNYLFPEETDSPPPSPFLPLADPWTTSQPPLTNSQLPLTLTSTSSPTSPPQLPPTAAMPTFPKLESQILEKLNHYQKSELQLATNASTKISSSNIVYAENPQVESKPNWLETSAKAMGYVKHPLQNLIEWLDQAIAIVEQFFIKIANWLK